MSIDDRGDGDDRDDDDDDRDHHHHHPCYAAGTRILTARGEVAVEELQEGDLVLTLSGKGPPLKPIKWIGRRDVDVLAHPRPELARPVRISAGAFGEGMPRRDLVVSPDHAVFVDGVLVNAAKLVNGITVVQDPATESVRYFHIELATHDILLAEGMPAESYLDTGNRAQFSNSERVVALHPDFAAKQMQTDACVPFVADGPVLAGIRQRLIERVAAQGYVVSHEPELCLAIDGRTVRPLSVSGMAYRFELAEAEREIRIVSRSGIPGGVTAENTDMRRLGVCLCGIVLHAAGRSLAIAIDHPALGEGFQYVESNAAMNWRWTDGNALLPVSLLDGLAGAATLELRLLWPGAYWIRPDQAEESRLTA